MCLVFVCDQDEQVVGRKQAMGVCPYCGGAVQETDVHSQWRLCFVPLCSKAKRKFHCSSCNRRLSQLTQ